jgi:hypothetical protein
MVNLYVGLIVVYKNQNNCMNMREINNKWRSIMLQLIKITNNKKYTNNYIKNKMQFLLKMIEKYQIIKIYKIITLIMFIRLSSQHKD